MKRFFGRREGERIIFEGGEAQHIARVLRMGAGDKVIASTNDESDYYCTLTEVGKNKAVATIDETKKCPALPRKEISLFISMPKREYFETIVTKAVELGASDIQPFISQFSVNHDFKRERTEQIVMTACKQCERSKLVPAGDVISFDKMLSRLADYDMVIFANEHAGVAPFPQDLKKYDKIAVVVGCEGGFSEVEAEQIIKAGAKSISLGARILRCDTACLATLALVNLLSGN